ASKRQEKTRKGKARLSKKPKLRGKQGALGLASTRSVAERPPPSRMMRSPARRPPSSRFGGPCGPCLPG
ncbi:hypothetical protein KEM52_005178, partial [Ascosphaera acerosa]